MSIGLVLAHVFCVLALVLVHVPLREETWVAPAPPATRHPAMFPTDVLLLPLPSAALWPRRCCMSVVSHVSHGSMSPPPPPHTHTHTHLAVYCPHMRLELCSAVPVPLPRKQIAAVPRSGSTSHPTCRCDPTSTYHG
jgi:hypothetical protein